MQPIGPGRYSLRTKISLLSVVALLGGIIFSVNLAMQFQQGQTNAWYTSQSAKAICSGSNAMITVSFTNTETNKSLGMIVIAKDIATGQQVNLGTIGAQETKTATITIPKTSLASGGIIFNLLWASGAPGTDQRNAAYTAITCTGGTGTESVSTEVSLTTLLDAVGMAGDRMSPGTKANMNPRHPQRSVTVKLYNAQNNLAATGIGTLQFDKASGSFKGTITISTALQSGPYIIKITTPYYLTTAVPGIQNITAGKTNQLPTTSLVVGDVTTDNQISILDYNILIGCYSDLLPAVSCTAANKAAADLNDDGAVNQFDYNTFLRELSTVQGK